METSSIKLVSPYWWLMLLGGLALIALGVWTFASPATAYLSLSLLFAIGILIAGILEIIFSLSATFVPGWGWLLAGGLFDSFIGGYLLAYPVLTMVVLPLLVGVWILFRGFMAVGHAFDARSRKLTGWGWLLFTGIVVILLAMLILANPAWGVVNIILWTGLAFIFAGIFRVYLSFRLRS